MLAFFLGTINASNMNTVIMFHISELPSVGLLLQMVYYKIIFILSGMV
jgi:hypothetical protein